MRSTCAFACVLAVLLLVAFAAPAAADEGPNPGVAKAKLEKVYVGSTLREVMASASSDAQPTEWWDVVCIVVILLLIAEALVANRRETAKPAHFDATLRPAEA